MDIRVKDLLHQLAMNYTLIIHELLNEDFLAVHNIQALLSAA